MPRRGVQHLTHAFRLAQQPDSGHRGVSAADGACVISLDCPRIARSAAQFAVGRLHCGPPWYMSALSYIITLAYIMYQIACQQTCGFITSIWLTTQRYDSPGHAPIPPVLTTCAADHRGRSWQAGGNSEHDVTQQAPRPQILCRVACVIGLSNERRCVTEGACHLVLSSSAFGDTRAASDVTSSPSALFGAADSLSGPRNLLTSTCAPSRLDRRKPCKM